jgi:hypothetical protein
MKKNKIGLIKTIETDSAYNPLSSIWWMNNDISCSTWGKKKFGVNPLLWEKLISSKFTPVQKEFGHKNSEYPFFLESWRGEYKGSDSKIVLEYTVYNKTKTELKIRTSIYFDPEMEQTVEELAKEINEMTIFVENKSSVFMVTLSKLGLELNSFDINVPDIDLSLNYTDDWEEKHDYLISVLSRESKKGIALLHGLPGTGKSMYIRYLISILAEERTMIYLPNQLIGSLTDPSFIPLMAENPNSIIIIEDADEAIKSREQGGTTVDKLLNLSDGIISDFLGTQIICTFNNDINQIDSALLRKGRLILKHEFTKLPVNKARKLADKLGLDIIIEEEMTLADIYNSYDKFAEDPSRKSKIGFS